VAPISRRWMGCEAIRRTGYSHMWSERPLPRFSAKATPTGPLPGYPCRLASKRRSLSLIIYVNARASTSGRRIWTHLLLAPDRIGGRSDQSEKDSSTPEQKVAWKPAEILGEAPEELPCPVRNTERRLGHADQTL
jgi:hypothetical protein